MRRMIGVFGGNPSPPEGAPLHQPCNAQPASPNGRIAYSFRVVLTCILSCQRGFRMMAGGNPDSNTLLSDMATVICLDDYHCLDRHAHHSVDCGCCQC